MAPRKACGKTKYPSKEAALAAGIAVSKGARYIHTYRCETCRYPGGKRAWHWSNWSGPQSPPGRRRT